VTDPVSRETDTEEPLLDETVDDLPGIHYDTDEDEEIEEAHFQE